MKSQLLWKKKQKQEPIKTPLEDAFDTAGRNKKRANSNFGVQRGKKKKKRQGGVSLATGDRGGQKLNNSGIIP